jgi:creatinine amidohydrolase
MLHLNPDEVRTDRSKAGELRPINELLPELLEGGVAAVSSSGVLGDPSGADASEGVRLLDLMVEEADCRIAEGLLGRNGMLAAGEGSSSNRAVLPDRREPALTERAADPRPPESAPRMQGERS